MTSRYASLVAAAVAVGLCAAGAVQTPVQAQGAAGQIRLLPLRGNVYVLTGAGGNITASVGKDGVLLVNTGAPTESEKVLAAVKELSRRVTGSPTIARSCVGVTEGCNWWSSSEFLPTTAGPRAPTGGKPPHDIANTIATAIRNPRRVFSAVTVSSRGSSFAR